MLINVVLYENKGWIIDKFANEIARHLKDFGHDVLISATPVDGYQIYHHLLYYNIDRDDLRKHANALHSVMITHLDTVGKLNKVRSLGKYENVQLITMSKHYQLNLKAIGIPGGNLKYLLAPKNENIKYKSKLTFGVFSNYYDDGRKNEDWLIDAIKEYDIEDVSKFIIYGKGWREIISGGLSKSDFVEFYEGDFNENEYDKLLDRIDYFVYVGWDEGSMAFLDAISKRKKTIVTPQGFHSDLRQFITHTVKNKSEFINCIMLICDEQRKINDFARNNWKSYTEFMLNIWLEKLDKMPRKQYLFSKLVSKIKYYINRRKVYSEFGIE